MNKYDMSADIERVLLSEQDLKETVARIGKEICQDYKDSRNPLILVSVLKGSVVFMGDLMRAIDIPCFIDFMSVSSYGAGTTSSGVVKIIKDLDTNVIEGANLLLVEDILDSGKTLCYLKQLLQTRNPASVKICTLLDKPDRRTAPIQADYVGATIPDAFVVGYGLDYAEQYRNLPYVGILKPSVYGGE
ncbi:MAG: hypoxanthine phosphoribosyltransferase [Clostridia bacterium]|nr:hypoxanthine phosphoribosyltransferase [Clostridia bacterium]